MVQLAERMEHDVAAFEHGLHDKSARPRRSRPAWCRWTTIMSRGGLAVPQGHDRRASCRSRRCAQRWAFTSPRRSDGFAAFEGLPEFRHYNPIGTVHGGFAATLLDSALGCAIFRTMAKGEAWTTLELKLNLVRPISKDTGPVRAEGRIIHRGRTVATAEGTIKDRAGKLYAHATTTCMIFPAKAG